MGKERSDTGYRYHEASCRPRSSGNGARKEPAANVTGARLPDSRRDSAQIISFPPQRRNGKARPAIVPQSQDNLPSLRPASRARFGRGAESPVRAPLPSKVAVPDRLAAVAV